MPNSFGSRTPTKITRKRAKSGIPASISQSYQLSVQGMSIAVRQPGLALFTLLVIYKNLYILGATIMRHQRRFLRRNSILLRHVVQRIEATFLEFFHWFGNGFTIILKRILAPYTRVRNYYQYQQPIIRQKRKQGQIPVRAYLEITGLVIRMLLHILFSLFNYAAPIAAAVFLFSTINTEIQKPVGLQVSYEIDGQITELGYVQTEKEYEAATEVVLDRIISDSEFTFVANSPIFTLGELPNPDVLITTDELANNIIKASGSEIEPAFGLYINNVFYGAVTDSERLLNEFDLIRMRSSSGKANETLRFDKNIRTDPEERLYPSSSIVTVDSILSRINRMESYDEVYVVQEGDSPSVIADKLNVPFSLLTEMNPEIEEGVYVGDEIYTARAKPFLSVRSIYQDVYDEEFPFEVIETQNATYARGYRNPTQEGVPGLRKVTAEITTLNGIEISREILDSVTLVDPVPERVVVGVNNPRAVITTPSTDMTPGMTSQTGGFIWPAASGYISCYLGGYAGHTGIDIASKPGTPIYASADGTVVQAKYSGTGYGNHIIIDHGNGYHTMYAHNNELYVSVGDIVAQGQVIAAMGRTGRATGNHVHFEVRLNGNFQNPVNYVGNG